MSTSDVLKPLLHHLQIPADYARYESIIEDATLARLDEWKQTVDRVLSEIRSIIEHNASDLSIADQADVVSAAATFDGEGPWISETSRSTSEDILQTFSHPQIPLLSQLLNQNIKPLFQSNPHPSLNVTTGRKLARPAGGHMASQDFYEGQSWKASPGAPNLVFWCVQHVLPDAYHNLWHLIIPPVMALLDDFEARYKLRGAQVVSEMLYNVPGELLKRTGVDGLIRTSLSTCLTHLQSPEAPQLIQEAVSASLSLTLLTTDVGSSDRFDQLCALLGEGIISGIWTYAYEQPDVIIASVNALPPVLSALGIGSARYLKTLVPQLLHSLKPNPVNASPPELRISSLRSLSVLIEECSPCLPRWKTTIVDAVARCWVEWKDSGSNDSGSELVQIELRHTCEMLGRHCSSVIEQEYRSLLSSEAEMFGDLLNLSPG